MDYYGINVKDNVNAENTPDLGSAISTFGTLYGEATSAQWADLAEKYTCKGNCSEGTVICISSDDEVDAEPSNKDLCASVIGVISLNPAYRMNESLVYENAKYVGLVGRLPVRVVGPIKKSEFIVPTENGCARAGVGPEELNFKIGISLETDLNSEEKLVECVIK